VTVGAPLKAQALKLPRDVQAQAAVRAIINHCMAQVLGNASEIAHGDSVPDHLHQLRVGLRRLRTALGDLGDLLPAVNPAWQPALREIFSGLGAARDIDALELSLLPALHQAGAGELRLPVSEAAEPPRSVLVASATNILWLELLACAADDQAPVTDAHPQHLFAEPLRARLAHLHKQIKADARRFGSIDDEHRHRVRKRIQRLRYLCDFSAGLFGKKSRRRVLAPLAAAQEALGQFNDVCVAQALFKRTAQHDSQAMFALGWLAHEREAAIGRCVGALKSLRKAPVFW
jgi:CHAD domain-containing protein